MHGEYSEFGIKISNLRQGNCFLLFPNCPFPISVVIKWGGVHPDYWIEDPPP